MFLSLAVGAIVGMNGNRGLGEDGLSCVLPVAVPSGTTLMGSRR